MQPLVVWEPLQEQMANSADPDQMLQNVASDQGLLFANSLAIFSLGIFKLHSRTYLKLKLESSSI